MPSEGNTRTSEISLGLIFYYATDPALPRLHWLTIAKCLVGALGYGKWTLPVLGEVQWHFLSALAQLWKNTGKENAVLYTEEVCVPLASVWSQAQGVVLAQTGEMRDCVTLNTPAVHQEKLTFCCFLSAGSTSVVKKPWGKIFCSLLPRVKSHGHVTTAYVTVNKIYWWSNTSLRYHVLFSHGSFG